MTPCLTPDTIQRYRDGTFRSADEIDVVDSHLANCAACRAALWAAIREATPTLAHHLLPSNTEPTCLTEDQLTAYVEGQADDVDREVVEAHLARCLHCREDVASLRAFHTQMQTYDWSQIPPESWSMRFRRWIATASVLFRTRAQPSLSELWMRWHSTSLTLRILSALILGVLTGLLLGARTQALQPISEGVLHLLSAVATPLIFVALLHTLMRAEVNERTARKLVTLLLTNTLVAIGIGLLVINLLHPGNAALLSQGSHPPLALPPVPKSIFAPLVENNTLYVIFIAIGLGAALRVVRHEQIREASTTYRVMEDFLEMTFRCLLRLLQWVISLVPLVVFVISADLVGRHGLRPFRSLGGFVLAVLVALSLQTIYYLLRLRFGSWVRPRPFLVGGRSALLTAFSTASSLATMPVTYSRIKERLQVRDESASLGVLIGGTLNRDGTALFEAMGVLFIAQTLNLPLHPVQQGIIVLMALVASVCAPGIPMAGLVTMVLVFQSLGLPEAAAYIVLLMPLDWLLDRCRTAVNVMGHLTVACLMDGKELRQPIAVPRDDSSA